MTAMGTDLVIGWVHPGQVHAGFMESLMRSLVSRVGRRFAGWSGVQASANVSGGRNKLVEWFLGTQADWLLMVDTDMVWDPDALERLLEHADPADAPIVGGLCFARDASTGAIWPTLFHLEELDGTTSGVFLRHEAWPDNAMFRVGGTGAAFLLMHRSAAEAIRDWKFSKAYPWFQETENAAGRVSEDLTFCARAHELGIPVHVHTGVEVGHIKPHTVTADTYWTQQALLAERADQPA